jgi:hypothetical protein
MRCSLTQPERRHSSLGNLTPDEFELRTQPTNRPNCHNERSTKWIQPLSRRGKEELTFGPGLPGELGSDSVLFHIFAPKYICERDKSPSAG